MSKLQNPKVPKPAILTDDEVTNLWESYQNGSAVAFERLVRILQGEAEKIASMFANGLSQYSKELIKDSATDSITKALRYYSPDDPRYNGIPLRRFFLLIAKRNIYNTLHKIKAEKRGGNTVTHYFSDLAASGRDSECNIPIDDLLHRDTFDCDVVWIALKLAMRDLNDDEQLCIFKFYAQGMNFIEISEGTKLGSPRQVKKLIQQAAAKLKCAILKRTQILESFFH